MDSGIRKCETNESFMKNIRVFFDCALKFWHTL